MKTPKLSTPKNTKTNKRGAKGGTMTSKPVLNEDVKLKEEANVTLNEVQCESNVRGGLHNALKGIA